MDKIMLRPLMGAEVRQKTVNSQLCLTDLAQIYEIQRIENGWVEKDLSHFFKNISENEYIIELLELQGAFINLKKVSFIEQAKNQGIIKALKTIGEYKVTGRGENKAVYCNPYIFVAVAQWLNPRFRAMVTIWVTDQLILNRIEAGHEYNVLCAAISEYIIPKISENASRFIYSNFAKLINKKVFGEHKDNLRQVASKDQLRELNKLETKLTTLIEVGHISTYQEAKNYLSV